MPTGKHYDPAITGKTQKPSMWDYVEVLKDIRVVVMIFQYSACFGISAANITFSVPNDDLLLPALSFGT